MGNLFCKQTSIPATSDLSMAIDPTGTNFLQIMLNMIILNNNPLVLVMTMTVTVYWIVTMLTMMTTQMPHLTILLNKNPTNLLKTNSPVAVTLQVVTPTVEPVKATPQMVTPTMEAVTATTRIMTAMPTIQTLIPTVILPRKVISLRNTPLGRILEFPKIFVPIRYTASSQSVIHPLRPFVLFSCPCHRFEYVNYRY